MYTDGFSRDNLVKNSVFEVVCTLLPFLITLFLFVPDVSVIPCMDSPELNTRCDSTFTKEFKTSTCIDTISVVRGVVFSDTAVISCNKNKIEALEDATCFNHSSTATKASIGAETYMPINSTALVFQESRGFALPFILTIKKDADGYHYASDTTLKNPLFLDHLGKVRRRVYGQLFYLHSYFDPTFAYDMPDYISDALGCTPDKLRLISDTPLKDREVLFHFNKGKNFPHKASLYDVPGSLVTYPYLTHASLKFFQNSEVYADLVTPLDDASLATLDADDYLCIDDTSIDDISSVYEELMPSTQVAELEGCTLELLDEINSSSRRIYSFSKLMQFTADTYGFSGVKNRSYNIIGIDETKPSPPFDRTVLFATLFETRYNVALYLKYPVLYHTVECFEVMYPLTVR